MKPSVLVVDDEKVICDVLRIALTKAGFDVHTAMDAKQAKEKIESVELTALLTDKNLPDESGLEVIKAARAKHPYCACLMMTGYANVESVVEALRLGASDYLEKPFGDLRLLTERLKTAIEHQKSAFERAALVEAIRHMEKSLKSREHENFQQKTELELFQSVLELKIDEANEDLSVKLGQMEAEKLELEEQLTGTKQKLAVLRAALEVLAGQLRSAQTDSERKKAVEEVAKKLSAHASEK
jgi:DNA-binding NtrC family response regulator